MSNFIKLFIIFPILLFGCKNSINNKLRPLQKIDNLEMSIYSKDGIKVYSINSPISSYDLINHTFNFKKTTINLFQDEEIKYILNSDESKLSENNKLLELIGNVEIKTVLRDNDTLYANKFIWNIDNNEYLLEGNVKFENNSIILTSNKATLNDNNIIEFFNPVKYVVKQNNQSGYEILSENAFYDFKTKSVRFSSKDKPVKSKLYF